jgi:hypothetical protein
MNRVVKSKHNIDKGLKRQAEIGKAAARVFISRAIWKPI